MNYDGKIETQKVDEVEYNRRVNVMVARKALQDKIDENNRRIVALAYQAVSAEDHDKEQFYMMRALNTAKDNKSLMEALTILDT